MIDPVSLYESVERLVDPASPADALVLEAWVRRVREILPPGRGAEIEARGELPAAELAALVSDGLGRDLVPQDQGGTFAWSRLGRICARLAAHDLDFTLCLGGAVLGSLPVLVAGDAHQRSTYFAPILRGEMGGCGLTEWTHGSDLLAGETTATPVDASGVPSSMETASHFRLNGTKAPINNGTHGACLVLLARTGGTDAAFAHSLFLVPRSTPGLGARARFATVGHRSMDLSGAVLKDATVPRSSMMGAVGDGFAHARRALEISRSGVAAMTLGPMATALALAFEHARSHQLYGAPIDRLGGVRVLLARSFARLCVATALARRASRTIGRWPVPGRALSCASKLLCPALLEETIADCGTLLGARSLMVDLPYARLRRSAPTLAIFDGSSQLQLDELWRHAAGWRARGSLAPERALGVLRTIAEPEVAPFDPHRDDEGEVVATTPAAMLEALSSSPDLRPFAAAAEIVSEAAGSMRGAPQHARFRVSDAAAKIYAITALAESRAMADDEDARAALGSVLALYAAEIAGSLAAALIELAPDRSEDALAVLKTRTNAALHQEAVYRVLAARTGCA